MNAEATSASASPALLTRAAYSKRMSKAHMYPPFLAGALYDVPPTLVTRLPWECNLHQDMRRQLVGKHKAALVEHFQRTCAYCGRESSAKRDPDGRPWCTDHVVPLGRGGKDIESNITLACYRCNSSKSYYLLEEWRAWHLAIFAAIGHVERWSHRSATVTEIRRLIGYPHAQVIKRALYMLHVGHLVADGLRFSHGTVPCSHIRLLDSGGAS